MMKLPKLESIVEAFTNIFYQGTVGQSRWINKPQLVL
jgi:hypothetical protein